MASARFPGDGPVRRCAAFPPRVGRAGLPAPIPVVCRRFPVARRGTTLYLKVDGFPRPARRSAAFPPRVGHADIPAPIPVACRRFPVARGGATLYLEVAGSPRPVRGSGAFAESQFVEQACSQTAVLSVVHVGTQTVVGAELSFVGHGGTQTIS